MSGSFRVDGGMLVEGGRVLRRRATLDVLEPLAPHATVEQLTAHRRFHRAVHIASHNALLVASLEQLWDQSDRYRLFTLAEDQHDDRTPPREASVDAGAEHRALVEAIADRDADTAAAVMARHIGTSLGARAARRLGQ